VIRARHSPSGKRLLASVVPSHKHACLEDSAAPIKGMTRTERSSGVQANHFITHLDA
jgi:hypothetical protein